ncbi:hypothetical protein ACSBR2_000522 [Camellia fascicularis]
MLPPESSSTSSSSLDLQYQFLNFLQAQVRELKKTDHANHTITVLLVGIPNVGKSALANSFHHIGRISAAEKGKLKHATVSPLLGETKDISSLKLPLSVCVYHVIAKVLPPEIPDAEVRLKLVLTGAINDCLIREAKLAQYFLAILNLSDEYKQWSKLSTTASEKLSDDKVETSVNSELDKRRKQYATDHTQVLGRESVLSKAVEKKQDSANQTLYLEAVKNKEYNCVTSAHRYIMAVKTSILNLRLPKFNQDGVEDDLGSASRGNWWQGRILCLFQMCMESGIRIP